MVFRSSRRHPLIIALAAAGALAAQDAKPVGHSFLDKHCFECHDTEVAKGGLDLTKTPFTPDDAKNAAVWVKVHDRVQSGEMPPKKKPRPDVAAVKTYLDGIAAPLIAADLAREAKEGRATWRRLNRYEYENSVRDLLQAPWLQVKDFLPEDGESHRFNKLGDALDISHVQMAQYLAAAEYALRQVMAPQSERPKTEVVRHYARDQNVFARKMIFTEFNRSPERATFPVLGFESQPEVRSTKLPLTVGDNDPATRELEAMGTVASSYEPIELRFDRFKAPIAGKYRLRLNAYAIWVGAGKPPKPEEPKPGEAPKKPKEHRWWVPDLDDIARGRRPEPITIYSETPPRQLRWQAAVDVGVEPTVNEIEVWLLKGETIRVDAARLFRSRPPGWHNPLAEKDGQPGVAFRWLEVEGPLLDEWPIAGHRLLYGDLPLKKVTGSDHGMELDPKDPMADAERLLRAFMARAYRRPVAEADVQRYLGVIRIALASGNSFTDALIAGYAGVLCSPGFVCLEEKPGALDDHALAARLSYFLWNSEPDAELRRIAAAGGLRKALAAQSERLLGDPRSRRFTDAFLDYWIDLRHINATSPDAELYPDYYLDDLLIESATLETQSFIAELVRGDLPARTVVAADFAMVNERLALHYGLPKVAGVALRKVALPADSLRGGLMTQASVLKVTANGTTTSPVIRGAWIMERVLGLPPPPPPPSVPAVEPDIRGAKTIREQLAKHRELESCAACHANIDPAGFALEQFDIMGGWRGQYRAVPEGKSDTKKEQGYGKNGQPFTFHLAQPVDASGNLPDGRTFTDVRELKKLLLADERLIARNLARQLVVYATGAPIRFGDRARVEQILDRAAASGYGVRTLIREIVLSPLFQTK